MSIKVRLIGTTVYFLPIQMRMPLKFGKETVTEVLCCRVRVEIVDENGKQAEGWVKRRSSLSGVGRAKRFRILNDLKP
jgi:hypothetical protein